jgi:general secretion pathway protein A
MTRGVYQEFFSFRTKPFELVPNPDFLYLSRTHRKTLTYLDYGIKEKAGFIMLTGEVGAGKTTLIRDLIKKLDQRATLSKVFNTRVNSEQLISMINDDFGLEVSGKDKVVLLRELYDFLIGQYAEGYHPVLIIDEAQNLSPELLEEVRLLSNLETDRSKLLQIILVGQPELRKTLSRPEMRQLRQRVNISCHLQHLTRQETEEYIVHRLEVAGNREAVRFHEGTFDEIHSFSRGVPRLINILCDFLLLTAYVEDTTELTLELVKEVAEDLAVENGYWQDEPADQPPSGDLPERLTAIERDVFDLKAMQAENVKISERLAAVERLLVGCLSKTTDDLGEVEKALRQELASLKDLSSRLSGELRQAVERRRADYHERMARYAAWRGNIG